MTLTANQVKTIVRHWGLEANTLGPPNNGYRSEIWPFICNNKQLVLIMYKQEVDIVSRIRLANAVGNYLAGNQMPVRLTADSRILRLCSDRAKRYFSLYNYLPGSTIPWEAYTMNHIKLLGWAMSDIHYYLKQAPFKLRSVTDEYRQIINSMHAYFARPAVMHAVRQKLGLSICDVNTLGQVLSNCDDLPIQHALHMDLVRGNVLFQTPGNSNSSYSLGRCSLSGILDLEKTASGSPVIDIARTLAFLLVDCKYKTEDKIRKYFLVSGYNNRGRSNYKHDPLLEPLVDLFLFHDFYKFLKHNPYEALVRNEHFERTKVLLIKRGLLIDESGKIV